MDTYDNPPVNSTSLNDRPIIREHYGFAEQASADAFGKRWVHPDDRNFVDRPPPHIPAPADHQEDRDIVAALRKPRAA